MLDLKSLFNLSYGMCIVSSKRDGEFNGCIVNTVFQVTPEPPMIAISVNKQNLTHEYIAQSKVFAVSVLAEGAPLEFIGRFGFRSGRDIDKFQEINYRIKSPMRLMSKHTRSLSAKLKPVRQSIVTKYR
jgi:flavin reductase (DIM6/NTAB) family NADH-FMN oxidoreductase RutF